MEFSHEFKVVKGLSAEWGRCFRTVSLKDFVWTISYWNNTIAAGSGSGDIITLDAITGTKMAILSGHTKQINCLTFSLDGKSLVSGSQDATVKLWDVQTGGVAKTFHGNGDWFMSVSISADCTKIVSGSHIKMIYLWNIQTGQCYCTIKQQDGVQHVSFSPTDPQHIISISRGKVWQWDINGNQILPTYDGSHIAFSPDHTQFALCNGKVITVHKTDSRAIVAEFNVTNDTTTYCCFSPDGKLVAAAAGNIAYVWDITSPNPHLIEIFVGHTIPIISLVFSSPSSLITASLNGLVKFWQIGVLPTDQITTGLGSTPLTSADIMSVSLQAKAGIAISSDEDGVVKTWDLSTGLCKISFQTPAGGLSGWGQRDAQLVDGKLIFAWYKSGHIHILDTEEGKLLQTLETSEPKTIRISGDGSKLFSLGMRSIQAWNMWTWELVGEMRLGLEGEPYLDSLCIGSSRVCVKYIDSSAQEGWDFGVSGSSPVPFDPSTGRPHLDFIGGAVWQTISPSWIKDTITGKEVFQLSGGIYRNPTDVQWDGQYLVAGYRYGEVLILDFHNILSRDV